MTAEHTMLRDLVPHQGASLFLDRVLAHDATATVCSVDILNQRWLKNSDRCVSSWLAVEYMAQCMTVHESLRARMENLPRESGMLVGFANLQLATRRFDARQRLRVKTEPCRGRIGLRVFSHNCRVFENESEPLAEARLTIALERPTEEK